MNAESLLKNWKQLSAFPGGKTFFSQFVGFCVPYSGSIHPKILELSAGYAKIELRDKRRVRNHLNSIHAIALANLGELASGLAFSSILLKDMRAIVTELRIQFLKKARGTLIAECRCNPLEKSVEQDCEIEALISDANGDQVARITAYWKAGPRKK